MGVYRVLCTARFAQSVSQTLATAIACDSHPIAPSRLWSQFKFDHWIEYRIRLLRVDFMTHTRYEKGGQHVCHYVTSPPRVSLCHLAASTCLCVPVQTRRAIFPVHQAQACSTLRGRVHPLTPRHRSRRRALPRAQPLPTRSAVPESVVVAA
jgi:hypothetical protein